MQRRRRDGELTDDSEATVEEISEANNANDAPGGDTHPTDQRDDDTAVTENNATAHANEPVAAPAKLRVDASVVPRNGRFFLHDERVSDPRKAPRAAAAGTRRNESNADDDDDTRWTHDKFSLDADVRPKHVVVFGLADHSLCAGTSFSNR
jgi:hypothetical protein